MTDEIIGIIQGQAPRSKEEWRVGQALDKYGWEYIYQYDVLGGKRLRGGQVIDFLVYTVPKPTALYIEGRYYHGSKGEAQDNLLKAYAFGLLQLVVEILTDDQLETQEEADSQIIRIFGRNK